MCIVEQRGTGQQKGHLPCSFLAVLLRRPCLLRPNKVCHVFGFLHDLLVLDDHERSLRVPGSIMYAAVQHLKALQDDLT